MKTPTPRTLLTTTFVAAFANLVACSVDNAPSTNEAEAVIVTETGVDAEAEIEMPQQTANSILPTSRAVLTSNPARNADRKAYFGDLHVHTTYSFDAFAFGTLATPYDAYRYAMGEAIRHPGGFDVQLRQPLDFYAVTDHAMFLGLVRCGPPALASECPPHSRVFFGQGLDDQLATAHVARCRQAIQSGDRGGG